MVVEEEKEEAGRLNQIFTAGSGGWLRMRKRMRGGGYQIRNAGVTGPRSPVVALTFGK